MNYVSVQVSNKDWVELKGKFLIYGLLLRIILYFEGLFLGIDIFVNILDVKYVRRNCLFFLLFYEVCVLIINSVLKFVIV